jgi:nucleotide-binding universal stress UspA family protein
MLSTIIVPLDGSDFAARALPHATELARSSAAKLTLMRVLPEHGPESSADAMEAARAALSRDAEALRATGLPVDVLVRRARPIYPDEVARAIVDLARPAYADEVARAISDLADEQRAELIVLSVHGRSGFGRWLYGSVPDSVLQQSSTPVLLVPPRAEQPLPTDRPLRLLVPLDGSELAEEAIEAAELLVGPRGAEVTLLRVVEPPPYPLYGPGYAYVPWDEHAERASARRYLQPHVDRLQARGIRVTARVAAGGPAWVIGQVAREAETDIVVMATHGRSGLTRLVLGSIATSVLQQAENPVLLVRPAAMRQADGSPDSAILHLRVAPHPGAAQPTTARMIAGITIPGASGHR